MDRRDLDCFHMKANDLSDSEFERHKMDTFEELGFIIFAAFAGALILEVLVKLGEYLNP